MYNVIIVDDEVRIAEGLRRIIMRMDGAYEVTEIFNDSEEAYRYLKQKKGRVDLLITDICMPVLSGLELIEKVRKFDKRLPCIILTGYGEFEYAQKAISLGVIRYLLKPVDIEELVQVMGNLVIHCTEIEKKSICLNLSKEVLYIKKEIESNFKDFNMDEEAEKIGLSKDRLYRLFRKEMNISVNEYLQNVRLERAKQYMAETGTYKIYEVCEKVGYEEQRYFSKIFKKKFKVSPKEFQRYGQNIQ